MSYTPTDWQTGDTITAEKLNKMEQGIAGGSNDVFTFVAEMSNGVYTFDHTFNEIADAVANGKTIVCILKWAEYTSHSFVTAYMDSTDHAYIVVTPVVRDVNSAVKPFTIHYNAGDSYVCYIHQDDTAYIVPLMDFHAHQYTVPMASADASLAFYPINEQLLFGDTTEQLILASMQMSDVATVFSDWDMIATSDSVISRAIENFGRGRGVVAYHSFNSGLTKCGMFMTGFTETKNDDNAILERTAYSNIDVISTTTDQTGAYSGITTGHGTITFAVKYIDGLQPISAMAAIHMDVHTPQIL